MSLLPHPKSLPKQGGTLRVSMNQLPPPFEVGWEGGKMGNVRLYKQKLNGFNDLLSIYINQTDLTL